MIKMRPPIQISGRIWQIVLFSTIFAVVNSSSPHQPRGFISIDCGSASQYKDSLTNLTWETDEKYMPTGMNGVVRNPPGPSTDNYEAMQTFRYFPDPQSKYCYQLLMATGNISVLIRAIFCHGNSSQLILPIAFKVYVNNSLWNSIQYDYVDVSPKVMEGIFYSPGNVTYICLVPDQGVPFISSLELRQLDPDGAMYSFKNKENLLLSNIIQYNVGADVSVPTVRYPDDAYDRLWSNPGGNFLTNSGISLRKENANTSSKWNNVPPKVMMDAAFESHAQPPLQSGFWFLPFPASSRYVYAVFYSQALNETGGVNMVISLNAEQSAPFNVTSNPVLTTFSHLIFTKEGFYVNVSSPSGIGAILNAMELYEEILLDATFTFAGDVRLMSFLKTTFNLNYWQGDPCFPVPYDNITCSIFDGGEILEQGIASLYLANLNGSARLQNTASLIEGDTTILSFMSNLTITHSYVDDNTARLLVENFTANSYIYYINLSYNSLRSYPNLTGQVYLQLEVLDLSYNSISSDISSTYAFVGPVQFNSTNSYIEEIHLSDNLFSGVFPSDLYFSTQVLSSLRLLNLDRNNITGKLDLTIWYQQLQKARLNSSSSDQVPDRLYSFVNNSISDIFPNTEDFQLTIDFFMRNHPRFNHSGVLLAGNPFCNDAKSVTQRFLCRSTVNEIIYDSPKKRKNTILIVLATLGGSFLFVLGSIMSIAIWRLWRKLSITAKLLQEVQEELSSKEVQPVFYSYHELKAATRGFHQDNKLGSGGFGEVYKGILPDGSKLAVKRLFNSNKEQVLNDFLSEVVLISGIKHKHLIQLKGCCIKDEERILIYELAANGSLAEALWGKHMTPTLDWRHRLKVAVGVARGLSYLHEELQPRIIHRDIKAVNVLLDDNYNGKIADFGLAKPFAEEETHAQFTAIAGTRGYFAPEYVLEGQLTVKADVFSFGILLLEMVAGRKCIDPALPIDRVYIKTWAEDLQRSGMLVELLQPELRDNTPEPEFLTIVNVALSCIRNDPKSRPTMSQVVIMLLGNLEGQNFWKEDESNRKEVDSTFDSVDEESISASISNRMKYSRSEITYGDSEEVPFIRSQSFPVSTSDRFGSSSIPSVELSYMNAR